MASISAQVSDDKFDIITVLNVSFRMTEPKALPEIQHGLPGHGNHLRRDRGGIGLRGGRFVHAVTITDGTATLTKNSWRPKNIGLSAAQFFVMHSSRFSKAEAMANQALDSSAPLSRCV